MILSVIVPTYNVEKYIERCLNSILNQNIDSNQYEILVVNDGSTDNSAEIANRIASQTTNVKILNQKNGGLPAARNTGIINAVGKYLLFVDSDDYLMPNVLKEMIDYSLCKSLEIAMFSHKLIDLNKKEILYNVPSNESNVMNGIELFFKRTVDCAWQYLVDAEFLKNNNLYFFKDARFLEDAEWSSRLFSMAKRTAYKDILFYVYELRPGSLITSKFSISDEGLKSYVLSAINLKRFQQNKNLTNQQREFVNNSIIKFAVLPINMLASVRDFRRIATINSILINSGLSKLELSSVKGLKRLHGIYYNFSRYFLFFYFIFFYFLRSIKIRVNRIFSKKI
jgi:glycosyltransferase involved in cell wall biosynthesis